VFICDKELDVNALQVMYIFIVLYIKYCKAARQTPAQNTSIARDIMSDYISSNIRQTECEQREKYMKDSCPSTHYCVTFFDIPQATQHYKVGNCLR
jgi:hypothetical protein